MRSITATAARVIGRALATTASTLFLAPASASASAPRATAVRALSSGRAKRSKNPITPRPEPNRPISPSSIITTIPSTTPPLVLSAASPSVYERVRVVQQLVGQPLRLLAPKARKNSGKDGSQAWATEIQEEIAQLESILTRVATFQSLSDEATAALNVLEKAKEEGRLTGAEAQALGCWYAIQLIAIGWLEHNSEDGVYAERDLLFWRSQQPPVPKPVAQPEDGSNNGKGKAKKGKRNGKKESKKHQQ